MARPTLVQIAPNAGTSIGVTCLVGDLLIFVGFRDGSVTNPALPGGLTSIAAPDGTLCSSTIGWKRATTTTDSSGVFTNATDTLAIIIRNAEQVATPMLNVNGAGTTNTITFPAFTDAQLRGTGDWLITGVVCHRSIDCNLPAPAGATKVWTGDHAGADFGGYLITSDNAWPSTNVTNTGTALGWQSMMFAIKPSTARLNNYHAIKAGVDNAGQVSVVGGLR